MNHSRLTAFMERIMSLPSSAPGFGALPAGIAGTTSIAAPAVAEAKAAAIAFATAYRAEPLSQQTISRAQELEGALATIRVMEVVTDAVAEQLLEALHDLTDTGGEEGA